MSTVAASAATAIYGLSTYIDNERGEDHAGGLLPHDIALTVAMEIYGGVQARGEQTLEAMACLLSDEKFGERRVRLIVRYVGPKRRRC